MRPHTLSVNGARCVLITARSWPETPRRSQDRGAGRTVGTEQRGTGQCAELTDGEELGGFAGVAVVAGEQAGEGGEGPDRGAVLADH